MICNSCGGVLGRDCFNPVECEWITRQMEREDYRQEIEPLLKQANDTILTLQLANEQLQHEVELLKQQIK